MKQNNEDNNEIDPLLIDAMPTKELFIEMLTRDISLIPAIVDLVDNSTDGAKRLKGDDSYSDLNVRLSLDADEFKLSDNCVTGRFKYTTCGRFKMHHPRGFINRLFSLGCQPGFPAGLRFCCVAGSCVL